MRNLFVLAALIIASLAGLASCSAGGKFEEIFPAEATRKKARELDLQSVKEIYLNVSPDGPIQSLVVTDPQIIALLVEGLKTAITTDITNQVDSVEIIGKNDELLMWHNFASKPSSHAVSPEFIEAMKAAGVKSSSWQAHERSLEAERRALAVLKTSAPFVILLGLLVVTVKRRAKIKQ